MSGQPNLFNNGEAYERLMGRWSRLAGTTFLDWLALPQGLRWLDVGCGNGAFTEVLVSSKAPGEVIGVDPSEGQLAYARTRLATKSVEFRIAGAQDLPFADRSFDATVMALVITFVPDPLKAVQELVRVTRPGGTVATYMWDAMGGGLPVQPLHAAMQALGAGGGHSPNFQVSREERLRALWEQSGLKSIETRVIPIRVVYSDFDDFWQSNAVPVGPAGQAIHAMEPAQRERLKTHLRETLPQGPDGTIAYGAHANAIKGVVPA